jgi:hypothetical protein
MRSWRRGDRSDGLRSSDLLGLALFGFAMSATFASLQAPQQKLTAKKSVGHRANELTLAGLRPGRDTLLRATRLNKKADDSGISKDSQFIWTDKCSHQRLTLDYDAEKKVQVIRVTWLPEYETISCEPPPSAPSWMTGWGLKIHDSTQKLLTLYGEPDSKSPSTRDGQPLELWYYAFDWAGPEVPQVMEVLCTREAAGKPGRVVEITLAAPSL